MERISGLSNVLAKQSAVKPVLDSATWMGFTDLLPERSRKLQKELRAAFDDPKIYNRMLEYVEAAEFPEDMVPVAKKLNLGRHFYSGEFGNGKEATPWEKVVVILESGRIDGSLATFILVQHCLLGKTIELFASEEIKKEYIPKIRDFDLIGGWGLTELNVGSDASGIETTVRREGDDYIINGNKRWIGNANKDIMVVFAKDETTKEVQAFLIHLNWPGVKREMIKRKMALRSVQNGQLHFTNVRVPARFKLPGVQGFESVANLLAESRILVAWLASALSLGLYDFMMKYITQRKQFGKPITAYQLMQEKIFKVMSRTQANLFFCYNLYQRHIDGKTTIGQIAMAKGFCTEMLREAARFGREALGGNGIIADNHVMKVLVDAEVLFTYEGTYDINLLVAGRELTGYAAFKTR